MFINESGPTAANDGAGIFSLGGDGPGYSESALKGLGAALVRSIWLLDRAGLPALGERG